MTDAGATPNFFQLLNQWLTKLPTDIKILSEMIRDDQLKTHSRLIATGALFYIISPLDIIPDKIMGVIGHIDDVIILHITLSVIKESNPDRIKYYEEKYPETFQKIDEYIRVLIDALGALYGYLRAFVEKLVNRVYKKRTTADIVASPEAQEELFDEAMEYAADLKVDPQKIENALLTTPPNRLIEMLSSGLETEQKKQITQKGIIEKVTGTMIKQDGKFKLLGK